MPVLNTLRERFAAERPRGAYHAIDLAVMRNHDHDAASALLGRVMDAVAAGTLPVLPHDAFPFAAAADAFRHMAMVRHVGKVVLVDDDREAASMDRLDPRGTYLVSGGLAGLGLATARRLVERGARHLVLAARSAPSDAALRAIDTMRAQGATVATAQADFADPAAVRRVLAAIPREAPLRGIVHSAGLLEDGALLQQSWDRFARPLGPKVEGTWALHEATRGARLDFFVMYSSVASVLGSSGQANHSAANAFMDALAEDRRAHGLAAVSLSWGAWSEIGAAADRRMDARVGAKGIDVITPERGLAALEALMGDEAAHVAVFPVRWDAFLEGLGSTPPFLAHVAPRRRAGARSGAPESTPATTTLLDELREASAARRLEALGAFVGDHVARVIGAPGRDAVDPRQPLNTMGLDSLMAVELRNRLGAGLGLARSLPATLVFEHPTLEAIAAYLARELFPAAAAPAPAPAAAADAVGALDELSDEEIEKLFAKKTRKP